MEEWRMQLATIEIRSLLEPFLRFSEEQQRAIWKPAPQEDAIVCPLPACRRHRACQTNNIRRTCRRIAEAAMFEARARALDARAAEDAMPAEHAAPRHTENVAPRRPAIAPKPEHEPEREPHDAAPPAPRELYWPRDMRPYEPGQFDGDAPGLPPLPGVTRMREEDDPPPPSADRQAWPLPRLRFLD